QYQAAQAAGAAHAHGRGLLLDLARRPVWLAGIAANGVGFGLRFLALRDGSLVVVQLVVLTGVVFAVPLDAVLARRPIPPREVGLAAVTVAGLVLFLSAAQPAQGRDAAAVVGGCSWRWSQPRLRSCWCAPARRGRAPSGRSRSRWPAGCWSRSVWPCASSWPGSSPTTW